MKQTTKKYMSQFELMLIDVMKCLVPTGRMQLIENTEGQEHTWTSECIDKEGLSVVEIKKDGKLKAKAVYDYDTTEETVSYFR